MTPMRVTQEEVLSRLNDLPAFPKTVQRILETVDAPESSMTVLANLVAHDPAIAARVYAAAHKAAIERDRCVDDIYTATSLIGMQTVREIALFFSLSGFIRDLADDPAQGAMWRHSLAAGVCAQELAWHVDCKVSIHHAFIAGLLHDIGQFWLLRFAGPTFESCVDLVRKEGLDICRAEEAVFGVNHAVLGSWLVTAWGLPQPIASAVHGHHEPDGATGGQPLVNLLHVAEVLSNALELNGHTHGHVSYLSPRACEALGVVWDGDIRPLFGRIDARAKFMSTFLEG